MKLISWNVNGIRAWHKKGQFEWFLRQKPDFFCLQETKAHPDQLSEEVRNPDGYFSYFEFSKMRKGYSGVAVYTKHEPDYVEEGLGIKELDQEGRMLALFYEGFVLITCYFPNGGGGPVRLDYKLKYYDAFFKYIEKLKKQGLQVIFCGDINTAHAEVDLARPKENRENTGFLPIERAWIDKLVENKWVDVWRYKMPKAIDKYTYWDMKTRARERNVGWRIDYFFVSEGLKDSIKKVEIMDDVIGSDHCPILLEIKD